MALSTLPGSWVVSGAHTVSTKRTFKLSGESQIVSQYSDPHWPQWLITAILRDRCCHYSPFASVGTGLCSGYTTYPMSHYPSLELRSLSVLCQLQSVPFGALEWEKNTHTYPLTVLMATCFIWSPVCSQLNGWLVVSIHTKSLSLLSSSVSPFGKWN